MYAVRYALCDRGGFMRRLVAYSLPLIALVLSGCITRVTPYEVDRVDQELKGNRGIVGGETYDFPEVERRKTKTMYNIEIELSSRKGDKRAGEEIRGNRGYVNKKEAAKEISAPLKKKGSKRLGGTGKMMTPQVVYHKPTTVQKEYKEEEGKGTLVKKEIKTYVVQKGDTLQKISEEMYGTTKKWKKIFEANKDILGDPDQIRVGQKLIIPED